MAIKVLPSLLAADADALVRRVEKGLDELVVSQPGHALRVEVRDLRARLDVVEAQVAALRKEHP